jgi:bifunctional DNA-binding transcriptional regulator/antitoxin component of YhaV-PrlF toxin-antitoxin module
MSKSPSTEVHRRERAVNRRVQGDLGEFSAMEWLASKGAQIWIPFGHSPSVDLMAELDGQLLRIQVKTSTLKVRTKKDGVHWTVAIATSGGNRSWGGSTKLFDSAAVDFLFVVVGDGRRWFLPAGSIEGARTLSLGGAKYSELEVETGTPLEPLVYGDGNQIRIGAIGLGECQSGQMDSTVNRAATPTEVRILSPPSTSRHVLLRPKRQVTIPKLPCEEAGVAAGDRMRVRADGPGRVVFERIEERPEPTRQEPMPTKPELPRGALSSAR